MSDWEILGGNPAPGSVSSVNAAVSAFVKVANYASDARSKLIRAGSELGSESWTGRAAEAFRSNLQELPGELNSVAVSHQEASRALARFRDSLDEAQQRARALRARAQACADEIARNDAAAERAEASKTAAAGKLRTAQARLAKLRLQRAATLEPSATAALQSQIATTAAQVKRYTAERDAAAAEEARYRRLAEEARQRLKALIDDARRLQETLSQEAEKAAGALVSAEKNAHLPGAYQRFATDLKETIANYGPVFVDSFNLGVTLFSYAETFFPPGALVFKGCALIMGGLSIGTQLVVAGCSRDGMTTDRLLAVLGTALSTGAAVAAGAAGKVLSVGGKVVDGVSTYRKSGAEGVFVDGAFMLAGFGLSKAGGHALRSVMTELDKSPKTQTFLRDMSRAVRQAGDSGSKLVDSGGCRVTQSILKGANIPAGGWLPGNKGMLVTDPSHLADHALPHDVQARVESDASVALPGAVSAVTHTEDHLKEAVRDQLDDWLGTGSSHSEGDHLVNIHVGERR